MKKILILHGWLHSASTYKKLKSDLEKKYNLNVTLYEFPGFGNTPAKYRLNILENYRNDMEDYLAENKFDFIIAHSMGGNILLKAAANKNINSKIILLSPVYKGVDFLKPFVLLYPFTVIFLLFSKLPLKINKTAIKFLALFTINNWNMIDDNIIADVKKADVITTANLMLEMAYDKWTAPPISNKSKSVYILIGETDMVISRKKILKLKSDLNYCNVTCLKNTGHTAIVENYDKFLIYLAKIILRKH